MPINTKRVEHRRHLRFESLDDILDDARHLASSDVDCLGNWTLGMALGHLARTMHASIDGVSYRAPGWMRLMARLMKHRFLTKPMPAGFQLPSKLADDFLPAEATSPEDGVAAVAAGIERLRTESRREPHPLFGQLSVDQWEQLHLRHAELHLSFFVPHRGETA